MTQTAFRNEPAEPHRRKRPGTKRNRSGQVKLHIDEQDIAGQEEIHANRQECRHIDGDDGSQVAHEIHCAKRGDLIQSRCQHVDAFLQQQLRLADVFRDDGRIANESPGNRADEAEQEIIDEGLPVRKQEHQEAILEDLPQHLRQ